MGIRTLGIVGAGQMGSGIAQVAACARLDVVMCDVAEGQLDKAKKGIAKGLAKLVEKDRLSPDDEADAASRISYASKLGALADCDLVVEAATEDESVKRRIFTELDVIAKPEAILASNTSSISITRLAAVTKRPERFIGLHFMNPVPLMKLVELIRGLETSDETFEVTRITAERMGKSVVVSRDFPGFIVNRVLIPMLNEAVYALHEGVASAEDIDRAMTMGTNQPMGPLTLADFIGLDTVLAIAEVLHAGLGDPKYRPCPLLRQYVDAGRLGRKSGRGFFQY
jgi:3-hydroxybutyryl-CoA dehydrogenase